MVHYLKTFYSFLGNTIFPICSWANTKDEHLAGVTDKTRSVCIIPRIAGLRNGAEQPVSVLRPMEVGGGLRRYYSGCFWSPLISHFFDPSPLPWGTVWLLQSGRRMGTVPGFSEIRLYLAPAPPSLPWAPGLWRGSLLSCSHSLAFFVWAVINFSGYGLLPLFVL